MFNEHLKTIKPYKYLIKNVFFIQTLTLNQKTNPETTIKSHKQKPYTGNMKNPKQEI